MKCEIEVLSAIVRVWVDGDAQHGEPFDWSATACRVGHGRYELMGVDKRPPPGARTAVREALARMGATEMGFVRISDGKERAAWFRLLPAERDVPAPASS